MILRSQLGELSKLGQGGQGVVYRAPKATTKFTAAMVYKEYKPTVVGGIDFAALAAMPVLVEESLSHAQAKRLVASAAWPCALVTTAIGCVPTGFLMPAIPAAFFTDLNTAKGTTAVTAEFQHLLNHPSVLTARGISINDAHRYRLLRETASTLAFLHQHGACVGDISPKNLLYSLHPHEAVYFIDCDAMRINGISALPQVETVGWGVPAGEELATVHSDSYKLGLLALRLLAGDQDTTNPKHLPSTTPSLVRQLIIDALTNPPTRRPLPEAWTTVLANVIEQIQHLQMKASTENTPPTDAGIPAPRVPIVHARPRTVHSASSTPGPPPTPRGKQETTSAELQIGDLVRVRVPDDDRDGHVGRVVELFSYDPGVIVRFDDEPDPYAFQRNEVERVNPSAPPVSQWRLIRKPLMPGVLVRISVPGDDRDGHVGRVIELFSYDPGVIVRFDDEPDPYAFRRDEVEPVAPAKKRWAGRR